MSRERLNPLFYYTAGYFSLCFLLGGGVQNILLSNVILQFLAIPLLIVAFLRINWNDRSDIRFLLCLIAIALATPLLQLIPLPPAIWKALPLRAVEAQALDAIGAAGHWQPISMTPTRSWLSLLAMAPPVAIFTATLQLNSRERGILTVVAILFGLINAFIGLFQLAQGEKSPLRLYEYGVDAVGLFANRNHLAALLYALPPLAAAWIFSLLDPVRHNWLDGRRVKTDDIVPLIGAVVVYFILIGAELMTRSRAGALLVILSVFLVLLIPGWQAANLGKKNEGRRFVLGLAVLALVFAAQYGLYFLAQRFTNDPLADARLVFARVTLDGALKSLPFGTGLGSFVPVYMFLEKTPEVMMVYANHAHNDYLELLLETGVAGAGILLAFFFWGIRRGIILWRARPKENTASSLYLSRAALMSMFLIALHSSVDYPLRTEAILSYFAFCCALTLPPYSVSRS